MDNSVKKIIQKSKSMPEYETVDSDCQVELGNIQDVSIENVSGKKCTYKFTRLVDVEEKDMYHMIVIGVQC